MLLIRALLGCWLLALPAAQADVLQLTPTADTTLFEFNPTNNLGGNSNVLMGSTANGARNRAVLSFNPGALPTNVLIDSVTLTLAVTAASSQNSTFELHRLLVDWTEGNKTGNNGQPAVTGEATWNDRHFGLVPWSAPGGASGVDFSSTLSGSVFIAGTNSYTFASTPQMVADLSLWLQQPSANFGWLILSDSEGTAGTSRRFASRESSRPPVLEITYTVVPEPSTWGLLGLGFAALLASRGKLRRR